MQVAVKALNDALTLVPSEVTQRFLLWAEQQGIPVMSLGAFRPQFDANLHRVRGMPKEDLMELILLGTLSPHLQGRNLFYRARKCAISLGWVDYARDYRTNIAIVFRACPAIWHSGDDDIYVWCSMVGVVNKADIVAVILLEPRLPVSAATPLAQSDMRSNG